MFINHTPVRTCQKFDINHIEWKDRIPNKIGKFENTKIFQKTGKDKIVTDFSLDNLDIKYGTGLIDQIKRQANQ